MSQTALRLVSKEDMDKQKALEAALSQIERSFGKGSIMRLGQQDSLDIEAISTGSLGLDIAVYTDAGEEVDLMQDVNPRRSTPSRPTYESLGVADYDDD